MALGPGDAGPDRVAARRVLRTEHHPCSTPGDAAGHLRGCGPACSARGLTAAAWHPRPFVSTVRQTVRGDAAHTPVHDTMKVLLCSPSPLDPRLGAPKVLIEVAAGMEEAGVDVPTGGRRGDLSESAHVQGFPAARRVQRFAGDIRREARARLRRRRLRPRVPSLRARKVSCAHLASGPLGHPCLPFRPDSNSAFRQAATPGRRRRERPASGH